MEFLLVLVLGLVAGVLSGLFGIGGGFIIVPALTLLLHLDFPKAAGTSLAALLLPVGALGALAYLRAGNVDFAFAALIAFGLFTGAFFGAQLALHIPVSTVERAFGLLLILVGIRFLLAGA